MIEHGKRDARTWATSTGLAAYLAGTLFVPKEPAPPMPLSPLAAPLSPLASPLPSLAAPARPPQRRAVSVEMHRPETSSGAASDTQKAQRQHASSYYSPAAAALDASTAGSPGSCPDTAGIFVEVSGGGGQRVLASSAVAWDEGAGVYTARVRLKPPAGESSGRPTGREGGVGGSGSGSEQVEAVASIPSAGIVEIVGAGAAAGTAAMAVGAAAAGTAATVAGAAAAGTAATVVGAASSSTGILDGPQQWASPVGRTVTIRVKGQGGAPDTLITLEI